MIVRYVELYSIIGFSAVQHVTVAWKMPGICSKVGKKWTFKSKPGKKLKFVNCIH